MTLPGDATGGFGRYLYASMTDTQTIHRMLVVFPPGLPSAPSIAHPLAPSLAPSIAHPLAHALDPP